MDQKKNELKGLEYVRPEIADYGDLKELTATNQSNDLSDVPFASPSNRGLS